MFQLIFLVWLSLIHQNLGRKLLNAMPLHSESVNALTKKVIQMTPGQHYEIENPRFLDETVPGYALWTFTTALDHNVKITCTPEQVMECGKDEVIISTKAYLSLMGSERFCNSSRIITRISEQHKLTVGIISSPHNIPFVRKVYCKMISVPVGKTACTCGSGGSSMARIYIGQFKYMICQGTIIHARYVLSTAVCVEDFAVYPGKLYVSVGNLETINSSNIADEKLFQKLQVIKVVLHEKFESNVTDYNSLQRDRNYNVALLKLNLQIDFSHRSKPVAACLPYKFRGDLYPLSNIIDDSYNYRTMMRTEVYSRFTDLESLNVHAHHLFECEWRKLPRKELQICFSPVLLSYGSLDVYLFMVAGGGILLHYGISDYLVGINTHYEFTEKNRPIYGMKVAPFLSWIEKITADDDIKFCVL